MQQTNNETTNRKVLTRIHHEPIGLLIGDKYLIAHPDYPEDYIMALALVSQPLIEGAHKRSPQPFEVHFQLKGMADMPDSILYRLCDEMASFDNGDRPYIGFEVTSGRLGHRIKAYQNIMECVSALTLT